MLEFRTDAERIIHQIQKGQRMILTYRGKPVVRLEPVGSQGIQEDDPFYALDQLAEPGGQSLSNREIDEIVYGQ